MLPWEYNANNSWIYSGLKSLIKKSYTPRIISLQKSYIPLPWSYEKTLYPPIVGKEGRHAGAKESP